VASVLVALEAKRTQKPEEKSGVELSDELSDDESEFLRSIVRRAERCS
jgi:hypothetical protein